MGKLLLWLGLVLALKHHDGTAHKLVCYFTTWAQSRPGPASISPHDLDPFLCTHLIFAFASMDNNQIVAKDPQDEKVLYPRFNKLKDRNKELKTLLSIGGWNFGTSRFTTMLSTFANREKFIDSVISLLRTHGFDGLDLFFLYPGLRGSPIRDRWTFLFLIEELLIAFQKEALLTMRPRLLLSAAVSGVPYIVQTSYDVRLLGRLLDFINVLTYDLHGSWEKFTGHNSPLFSVPEDPKSSICSFISNAKKHWIGYQYVPYAYKGTEWVGYDDATSFHYKAWFVKSEQFGGAMVWTLDMDDVRGTFCGTGPFPLVYVLNDLLVQPEFSSTPLPQFWLSSAVNSSRTGLESPAVTKALTTNIKILPPGGEVMATEPYGKYENMTTTPRQGITVRRKETVVLGNNIAALGGKAEIPGVTSVDHQSVTLEGRMVAFVHSHSETPGETITPVGNQSASPGVMTIAPVYPHPETPFRKTITSVGNQSVTPGGMTIAPMFPHTETSLRKTITPVGNQSMTPGGMTIAPVHPHTETPRETITPMGNQSVISGRKTIAPVHPYIETPFGKTITPVRNQSVIPGGMTIAPGHSQTTVFRESTMALRKRTVTPEKVTVPPGKIPVTLYEQTITLRGENLTSEVSTVSRILGSFDGS